MIHRRLFRLLGGDFDVFEDIASDPRATLEAAAIAAVSSAIAIYTANRDIGAIALGAVAGVLGLAGWTAVLWVTGRLLGGGASPSPLARAVGYTAPPFALSGIPILGVIAAIGSVALQIVAVRRLHSLAPGRAAIAVIAPWLALVAFGVLVQSGA